MRQPKPLKQLDGVDIAHLRDLLEHPGWAIFAERLEWIDEDTCEAMRTCAIDGLRKLQGASDGLRVAEGLPAQLIAAWEAEQAKGARR